MKFHDNSIDLVLKLVEYRGFGLDESDSPEIVGNEAFKSIQEKINNNNGTKNGDYNDFFHCIWHCVSGARFEKSEIKFLEKLSQAYNKMTMPIIVVYTQDTDKSQSDAFVDYICKLPKDGQVIYCADEKGACEAPMWWV